ncbi:Transcriptional activator FtrB, partial [Dysosmobacter welbionis]
MVLQCPDRGHDHHRVGLQPRHAALDVQKLLRPQIRAEARFRDGIVPQLQSHPGGGDGVAAVGDVGKGSAVDQGRSMLQRLNQIGLQSVLQQGRHGAGRLQVGSSHRGVIIGVAHHDPPQTGFQIRDVRCQTQHGHDLAGHGDIKSVLPGHTLHPAPQAIHDAAQLPVVHIHTPPPRNPLDVDPQGVTLLDVVVQHRRQQVVGRADGVKVPGEVEIDVLHRHHLG